MFFNDDSICGEKKKTLEMRGFKERFFPNHFPQES